MFLADLHLCGVVLPAAAKRCHQRDARIELSRAHVHGEAALGDHLGFGVQHHDLVSQACLVALHREVVRAFGLGQ
ncbi:hypothetical protein SDC9_125938 [bioreactor metagenome]|uniref:Uncharacterized protein n=1 Tax=bioreactor metagenome TaxID=1076179 RepID=A0A645CPS8_9ZZZZ